MKPTKKLGIWMDHSMAYLMAFENDKITTNTLKSESTLPAKEQNMGVHERQMHDKEQTKLSDYYKKLSEVIIAFDDVVLFGPTDAKTELLNLLKQSHHFDKIKICTKTVDKMSESQQQAFVKEYFKVTN